MANTALPVITGTATEGQMLAVSNGAWTNSPTSYSRQWVRCDAAGVNCVALHSATGAKYTLVAADVGKKIRCWVTAFNAVGASEAVETAATAVIAALTPAVPVNVTVPTISGTPIKGNSLTVSNGSWTNAPTSYTYQWQRCNSSGASCVNISGSTTAFYVPVTADVGSTLRCTVKGVNGAGTSTGANSAVTLVIADWVTVAQEHGNFSLLSTQEVRYGANGIYAPTVVLPSGTYTCHHSVLGVSDPTPGVGKHCEARSTAQVPPPPPANWGPPITISTGGTYTVNAQSTSAGTPAVTINTASPVTITGRAQNTAGGYVIRSDFPGAQLTVDHVFAYGPALHRSPSNRWVWIYNFKTLIVRNCTIENTHGIQIEGEQANSTILITKNKHHNITGGNYNDSQTPGNFVQFRDVQNATIEVSWNEIINEYNKSWPTDIFSLYQTGNAQILDNYLEHQSEPGNTNIFAMNGISVDGGTEPAMCHDNNVLRNQVIDGCAIAVFGPGGDNTFSNNRIIHDGYLPDGVTRINPGWFEPIWVAPGGSGNHAHGNVIGYYGGQGWQYGRFPGCVEGDAAERANNTYLPQPITRQMELNEKTIWLAKVAAAGITLGA